MENVAVQSNPRGDVPDSGGDGDGDGESEGVDKTFIEFAQKLQSIAHLLNDLSDTMPSKVQDKPEVKQCLILVKAMSTCLKELIQFTESPLGQKATNLLWSHLNYFRSLAEIGVGTVIASIFLVVGQDVLDVTKDEFQYAKIKMETRMTNVKKMLNEIQNRVEKAVNLLEDLRKNESDRKSLLDDFDENVRLANLDIQECQRELEYANEDIADIMEKITGKKLVIIILGVFDFL